MKLDPRVLLGLVVALAGASVAIDFVSAILDFIVDLTLIGGAIYAGIQMDKKHRQTIATLRSENENLSFQLRNSDALFLTK